MAAAGTASCAHVAESETRPVEGPKGAVGAQPPFELLKAGSHTVAVSRRGKGRPVVCLHAAGHGARDFELLADRVTEDCEIIAIDFPGHGQSPADDRPVRTAHYGDIVVSVIQALRLKRPVILGNSIGGGAAITAAAKLKDDVAALVLCDSSGLIPPSPAAAAFMQQMIGMFQLGVARDAKFPPAFSSFYTNVLLPGPAAKPQRERIIAAGFDAAPLLADAWKGFMEPESYLGALVPTIKIPVWLAWAKNDQVANWNYCKPVAESFPIHSFDMFDGGHSPFMEDPDGFAAGLKAFLAQLR